MLDPASNMLCARRTTLYLKMPAVENWTLRTLPRLSFFGANIHHRFATMSGDEPSAIQSGTLHSHSSCDFDHCRVMHNDVAERLRTLRPASQARQGFHPSPGLGGLASALDHSLLVVGVSPGAGSAVDLRNLLLHHLLRDPLLLPLHVALSLRSAGLLRLRRVFSLSPLLVFRNPRSDLCCRHHRYQS